MDLIDYITDHFDHYPEDDGYEDTSEDLEDELNKEEEEDEL